MQFEKWTDLDISKGRAAVMDLGPLLFSGDNHALKLGVHVYNGTEPVTVTGSVAGSAIIANGQTITPFVTGKDGNAAWVEVPQAALVCQGRIEIFLRVSEDDEIAVSLYATGTVKRTTTGEAVNPGTVIPDIGTAVQECVDATAAATAAAADATAAASHAVRYDEAQALAEADKGQARTNIGAAGSAEADALGVAKALELTWAQGTISGTTGGNGSGSTRIRTNDYYRMEADTVVVVGLASGYDMSMREYTTNGTSGFISSIPVGVWAWDGYRVAVPAGHYLRFVARKSDDAAIAPADGANVTVTLLTGGAENLAPVETTTAAASYAVGDLLTIGGQLYRATQAIVVGDTITPGTNVETATVAQELSAETTARATSIASEAGDRERADTVLRGMLGLMDYRGEDADFAEVPGATNATCIGAVVRGETVTLNGTNNTTNYVYLRMSGNCSKNASSTTVRGWEGNFTSPAGHLIRCTLALISGTVDGAVSVSFYKSGASSTVGTIVRRDDTVFQREWTSDGDPLSVTLLAAKDTVLTNAKFLLVMQDITNTFGTMPTPPETNGTYILKVTVTDGIPAYSWVSE